MNKAGRLLLFAGMAVGGMALANRSVSRSYRPVYSNLDGKPDIFSWRDGIAYYHAKGEGSPIVMFHDFGLAASSYEMKPAYDKLAGDYHVYAVDWLGYGQSTRPAVDYTADAYEQFMRDFLSEVVGEPAVVIAAGQAAAFATRVANHYPDLVSHLILVTPTGVQGTCEPPGKLWRFASALLKMPLVGTFIYNLLASKPALKWDLENRTFFDRHMVTPEMLEYMWVTAHQPGAKYAPASFWGGLLNRCVAYDFAALKQPVMVIWGQQARKTPVEGIQEYKRYRSDVRYRAFDRSGQWPQYEVAHSFAALVRNWLQGKDHGAAAIFPGEVEPE